MGKLSLTQIVKPGDEEQPWKDEPLTEDEIAQLIDREKRRRYEARLDNEAWQRRHRYNEWRKSKWDYADMKHFIVQERGPRVLGKDKQLIINNNNRHVYTALCLYFTNNPLFEELTTVDEKGNTIPCNWKLNKGLLIAGYKGSGKTDMMKMFAVNQKACFNVVGCRPLLMDSRITVKEVITNHSALHRHEYVLDEYFRQEHYGICYDDLGTEERANDYGTKLEGMAHILMNRYDNKIPFHYTHVTTNLTREQIINTYGERMFDRMIEMFNFIKLPGESFRK